MNFKRSLFIPHSSSIMSLSEGPVYPALVREMLPNDKIVISHEALLRAAPMLFPLYSPVKMRFDYFFSPNRIVWKGADDDCWSAFITGSVNGKSVVDPSDLPEHPWITVPSGGFAEGSLADYLGFNTEPGLAGARVSAMRFRHYQQIIKDYYIDENFPNPDNTVGYNSGEDTTTSLKLINRCWNKDRFTTAAVEPQKGLQIGIPLSGDIPVVGNGKGLGLTDGTRSYLMANGVSTSANAFSIVTGDGTSADVGHSINEIQITGGHKVLGVNQVSGYSGLVAKISEATTIPVDELNFLVQLERLNQLDNMWGSRDFECIRRHFGCTIPDTRLQRATHLGWSEVDVNFSEVLQTSETTSTSAQGNITGHTLAVDKNRPVKFHCLEHGFLFVMVNIQPIAQYQQGIPRDALYQTRYDYTWPVLSQTGEQELFEAELYATSTNVTSRKVFGFEPRYNHMRYGEKTVHGAFRSSLSGYHAGRIFTQEPNQGVDFITADPTKRMFAVELQDIDAFWLRCEFDIKLVRRLPKFPNPGSIGKIF